MIWTALSSPQSRFQIIFFWQVSVACHASCWDPNWFPVSIPWHTLQREGDELQKVESDPGGGRRKGERFKPAAETGGEHWHWRQGQGRSWKGLGRGHQSWESWEVPVSRAGGWTCRRWHRRKGERQQGGRCRDRERIAALVQAVSWAWGWCLPPTYLGFSRA